MANRSSISPSRLVLIALGAFGSSTILAQPVAIAAILLGIVALITAIVTGKRLDAGPKGSDKRTIFGLIVIFSILLIAGPTHEVYGSAPSWLLPAEGAAWLILGFSWLVTRSVTARRVVFVLVLSATGVFGIIHLANVADFGLDVFWLHESAADAIASGSSPYSDAVTVPNGAPEGDSFIVGYPYPPVTALSYSIGSWLGDARWTSLVAWLITLAIVGAKSLSGVRSELPLGVMLASAAIPGWPLVLTSAWSEPLSLALLSIATLLWSKPRLFGMGAGLFFGSKQYLLASAPLMLTSKVSQRWARAMWASIALTISFLPILIWGIPDFIEAAIEFHLEAPLRTDGSSLIGLLSALGAERTWTPPLWLVGAVALVLAVVLGRNVTSPIRWLTALAAILATAAFLSSQALSNYWFLIAGISALTAGMRSSTASPETTPNASETRLAHRSAS